MDIKSRTDESLMSLYQAGSEEAFNELYARYKGRVYAYLIKRLNNASIVAEIYQNVFMKLHRCRDLYNPKYIFSKWLFTIVTTSLIDSYRSMGRHKTEELPDNLAEVKNSTEVPDIETELSKLSEADAMVIKLRYYEDKSFMEIADRFKTSQLNARQKLSRAVRNLRKLFSGRKI